MSSEQSIKEEINEEESLDSLLKELETYHFDTPNTIGFRRFNKEEIEIEPCHMIVHLLAIEAVRSNASDIYLGLCEKDVGIISKDVSISSYPA